MEHLSTSGVRAGLLQINLLTMDSIASTQAIKCARPTASVVQLFFARQARFEVTNPFATF
jgi:hypothetical protein